MAYGGTVKSQLPPKVPRPPSLSQNDFTVKASSSAKGGLEDPSSTAAGTLPGEWHWPSLTTAGTFGKGSKDAQWLIMTSAATLTCRRR